MSAKASQAGLPRTGHEMISLVLCDPNSYIHSLPQSLLIKVATIKLDWQSEKLLIEGVLAERGGVGFGWRIPDGD